MTATKWGSPVEKETKLRIVLAACAYAYEFQDDQLCSDNEFDQACRMIDLSINTTRPDLDAYFREHFDPSTGVWIHRHPELNKVHTYYLRLKEKQK